MIGETAHPKLGLKVSKGRGFLLFHFPGFFRGPESRATRHVTLPGPLIAVDANARFSTGQKNRATRTRLP